MRQLNSSTSLKCECIDYDAYLLNIIGKLDRLEEVELNEDREEWRRLSWRLGDLILAVRAKKQKIGSV